VVINKFPISSRDFVCERFPASRRADTLEMPVKESEAIVLRGFPLGEGDRLVSFLDRQSGRMKGVAKGARLPKSRFGSTLELLSYIRIWYFERETRDLVRINQCELIESFMDVQADYASGVSLALVSEITEAVLGEKESAEPQFRLVLLAARAIRAHGASPAVLAYFSLWTARLGGWLGPLDRCSRCGRVAEKENLYTSPGSSELACGDCRDGWLKQISNAALSVGRLALSGTLERLLKSNPSIDGSAEILSYSLDVLEHHIEKKLISRKILLVGESGSVEIESKE
jgi:DNA repair protein RecO (recombination protein O)